MTNYEVHQDGEESIWVTFGNFNTHIQLTDEGTVVDVWPKDDVMDAPLATTYAFEYEVEEV